MDKEIEFRGKLKDKAYSIHEGTWNRDWDDFIEELMLEHQTENERDLIGVMYFEGDAIDCTVHQFVHRNIDRFLDILGEDAYEIGGEFAEGWPDISSSEEIELENLIVKFLECKSPCNFYIIDNVVKKVITIDDITNEETP
jgi:hypothetical protein